MSGAPAGEHTGVPRRPSRPGLHHGEGARGSATAETALALPVLLLVLAAAVSVLTVSVAQLRCLDAAREGARAAARGEPGAVVRGVAGAVAPAGATVAVAVRGDDVAVTVRADAPVLGPLLPGSVPVSGAATARREPGLSGAGGAP